MIARRLQKVLLLLLTVCVFGLTVTPAHAAQQGTTGSELQIMEAEHLEINLGTDWAGTEFQLSTDAGIYPDTIIVGKDGLLKMELGGSSVYRLDLIQQVKPREIQTAVSDVEEIEQNIQGPNSDTENERNVVAGIPVLHLILFSAGMILASGSLIVLHIKNRRREMENDPDEDDG